VCTCSWTKEGEDQRGKGMGRGNDDHMVGDDHNEWASLAKVDMDMDAAAVAAKSLEKKRLSVEADEVGVTGPGPGGGVWCKSNGPMGVCG